jgi:hypothetical protein
MHLPKYQNKDWICTEKNIIFFFYKLDYTKFTINFSNILLYFSNAIDRLLSRAIKDITP